MKQITDKEINEIAKELRPFSEPKPAVFYLTFGATAQLASCEAQCKACADGFISTHEKATNAVREQERRAIGEWLDKRLTGRQLIEGKEALKQGHLPKGIKEEK